MMHPLMKAPHSQNKRYEISDKDHAPSIEIRKVFSICNNFTSFSRNISL